MNPALYFLIFVLIVVLSPACAPTWMKQQEANLKYFSDHPEALNTLIGKTKLEVEGIIGYVSFESHSTTIWGTHETYKKVLGSGRSLYLFFDNGKLTSTHLSQR